MESSFFRVVFLVVHAKPLTFPRKYVMLILANSCVKEFRGNGLWAKKRPTILSVFFRCAEREKILGFSVSL